MAKNKTFEKAWAKIIAKAWTDETFKKKLLQNPEKVLKEMGIALPADVKLELHQQTEKKLHLILPAKPQGRLSEQDLRHIAAGGSQDCGYSSRATGAAGIIED